MLRPDQGGIHPREAADHHVERLPGLMRDALNQAGVKVTELDGIAFSQGPGLGPCLRTVATAARALSARHNIPLVGVNHCVAHLEIGRATTGATDPVLLYASGANTQVIAEARGRYRVFGETLDIGIGNALDKFAREQGMPFPGGPRIEELALAGRARRQENGLELPVLPYSVKGMDLAFSGSIKAAQRLVTKGMSLEAACDALQEWTFAMLTEVTERALAHTEKTEVLLGGGVARNRRLQEMVQTMAGERGASYHCPEPALLSDNGAMIAWNGILALRAGHPTPIAASDVDQKQRTDDINLTWRDPSEVRFAPKPDAGVLARGAEAEVRHGDLAGRAVVLKQRIPKAYRDLAIERFLVAGRTRRETRHMTEARLAGVPVPAVLDADPEAGLMALALVRGAPTKEWMASASALQTRGLFEGLGAAVARLHEAGLVHGDLTTSNVLVTDGNPILIDFGLAERTLELEPRAVDLHVLQEALEATHGATAGPDSPWHIFLAAYQAGWSDAEPVLSQLGSLQARGRYMSSH